MAGNAKSPAEFTRRVLLAAAGLTPQVVTETVYALAHRNPPFYPTEIHLLTTTDGAERARLLLLSKEPGWFHRLCKDYNLPPIQFDENSIHVLLDAKGKHLQDIRTEADNMAVADQVIQFLQRFTADESCCLHVSMAGGRKTLGFFLAYALSLLGRPQDELSHVLVSPPYESHPEFFYPTRESRIIYTSGADSRPLDTSKAEVVLARIPLVRLRPLLRINPLGAGLSYSQVVDLIQRSIEPSLVIDLGEGVVRAAGRELRLPPVDLAFYAWMALRRKHGQEPLLVPSDGAPERDYAEEFQKILGAIPNPRCDVARIERTLREGMTKDYFLQRKARVNRALERYLGAAADPYKIQPSGRRPETRFGLQLPPERIEVKTS